MKKTLVREEKAKARVNMKQPIMDCVKAPLPNSRVNWIYDPHPNQSHRVKPRQTVPKINNNTVPKNNPNLGLDRAYSWPKIP